MKVFIAILVIVIIGGIVYFVYNSSYKKGTTIKNPPAKTQPNAVSIENMSFRPATLTIKTGTEVTWTNNDSLTHTITSDNNVFDSGNVSSGNTYKHTFDKAGTFPYHCSIHPSMTAEIVVQ